MEELTRKILTDKKLIANREKWFQRMRDMFDGKGAIQMGLKGIVGQAVHPDLLYTNPEEWMEEVAKDLAMRAHEAVSDQYFAPLCIEGGIYGVHFIDKIFGAEVFFQDNQWYNHYLESEVGELEKPDLKNNEVWCLAKRIAGAFLDLDVSVPLFGLPTIASSLNIAVNLYGEEILVAMLADPEAAEHDLRIINEVLMEIHQWYLEHIPMNQLQPVISWERTQPPGYGQICGCTTQLLSPELYEKFIYPLDNTLLGVYPNGGLIHLCGSHKQLMPLFARMENLKCVQLNDRAAEDLECYAKGYQAEPQLYVEGLREDQVIYLNPCDGMPAERGLEIAKDRRLVLVGEYSL